MSHNGDLQLRERTRFESAEILLRTCSQDRSFGEPKRPSGQPEGLFFSMHLSAWELTLASAFGLAEFFKAKYQEPSWPTSVAPPSRFFFIARNKDRSCTQSRTLGIGTLNLIRGSRHHEMPTNPCYFTVHHRAFNLCRLHWQ